MKDGKPKNENNDGETFKLRALTHQELASLYNVSWPTFQRWTKPYEEQIGIKNGHFYNVRQVIFIFKQFGIPQNIKLSRRDLDDFF